MKIRLQVLLTSLFCIILASRICGSAASLSSKDLLGVSPEDEKYYKGLFSSSSGVIKCKDGSKKFTKSQLNDDFCDCPDGSDEPGTSACPNGRFYCKNAGHVSLSIYSSRVNDGICDCCDGSDEYDGKIKCQNTCWEAGKVARDKLKKKIATYQEGVTIRKREVEQAKVAIAKEEEELSKLKNEEKILKGLVQQLKERKEQIEKAEEKERLQKEKEEKERKEAEEAKLKETKAEEKTDAPEEVVKNDAHDKVGLLEDAPESHVPQDMGEDQGSHRQEVEHSDHLLEEKEPSDDVVQQLKEEPPQPQNLAEEGDSTVHEKISEVGSEEVDASKDTESLSKEELGRLVASRWTGEKVEQQAEEDAVQDNEHESHEEVPTDSHNEEVNGYNSEEDEHSYEDDDSEDDHAEDFEDNHDDLSSTYKSDSDDESDFSDVTSTGNPSWLEKIQQTVRSIFQAVNVFQMPVDKSEADRVRKEYDESNGKLSKLQSKISSLTQKLKHDFGPEKEFYSFHGQCFESKQNKYIYKVCPFKQATQEEGHSTTRLGSWEKFEDSYRIMQFSNGDKCWNGPDRSLKVKLRCGLNNEVTDVDEPSRCEYLALLATPALCTEDKLKELLDKLNTMNTQQPQGHDEL